MGRMSTPPPKAVIALKVGAVGQLFDNLDPLPFRERDLDRQAEDYIIGWAQELPRDRPFLLKVHLPAAEAGTPAALALPAAFRQYFSYRAHAASMELKALFRTGRYALLIGAVVLALCVAASQLLSGQSGTGTLGQFLRESLIILGWVANWRPIQIFLYDWWPISQRRTLLRRLSEADVLIETG